MGEIKKGGEEFFSEKIRGAKLFLTENRGAKTFFQEEAKSFFRPKKGAVTFFSGKIRGANTFFQLKIGGQKLTIKINQNRGKKTFVR